MRPTPPSLFDETKPRQREILFARRRRREVQARERELTSRLEAVGWAAGHLAHALNNQLTVVLENARWMRHAAQDEEDDAALSDLCDSALECRALVAALQRWSKLQLRPPGAMPLGTLLDEMQSLLAVFLPRDASVAVAREITPSDEAKLLVSDPGAVVQAVLQHVTKTSERCAPPGLRLRARVQRERSRLLLELAVGRCDGRDAEVAHRVELLG